jgi:5,10-methylenetetrahydromethanopterin reductase
MARLGLVLYHGLDNGPEVRTYGHLAEAAGFESLWVTERYFHEETFSLLGFLAAATQTIKLGLGVTNPYTRHPALLAMASTTLDRLCGGRFLLGLGRSDKAVIQDRMGLPYFSPRTTLEDVVRLLRHLWAGARVTTTAGPFSLQEVRLALAPMQQPVPVYLAAIGPKALRLAGAVADGVLLNAYVPPSYVRYAVAEVRQGARAAGRDPDAVDIACMLVVRLTDDPADIWPGLKQRLVRLLAEPNVGEILLAKGGFDPGILARLRTSVAQAGEGAAVELITDAMVEAFYLVGSAIRCQERLAEYRQAGVDLPLLLPRLEDYGRVVKAFGDANSKST